MTPANVKALRIALGATTSVAVAYGMAWPLSFIMPLFAAMFLALPFPQWIGWKVASQLLKRLTVGLLMGLVIAEFFIRYPLLCLPLYLLIFFFIYYNDAKAPPMATIFMTMGVTMVPILALQATMAAHLITTYLFINMSLGLFFTWLFFQLVPNSLATIMPAPAAGAKKAPPAKPPIAPREERARLALVSTIVSTTAVMLFFTLNLAQYSLAMIYICMMAGTPNTNASIKVMKANSIACTIGGVAIIIAYNLLVAVPKYDFLVALTLCFSLFFCHKMTTSKNAASWMSGFTTFLVLLGSSTGNDAEASSNFYLRIAQILFAGIFCIVALIVTEHMLERRKQPRRWMFWRKSPAASKP